MGSVQKMAEGTQMTGTPNRHFIDKHTSIDDLLAKLVEQNALLLETIAPDIAAADEVHFFTYPKNGTKAALSAGTTELDYEQGTVIDVDGTTSDMNSSLRKLHKPACRSIALNTDQDIILQINNKDRIPITAGTWFKATFLRFQRVKLITTATTTNMFVLACTHPNAIDITGEVLIKDVTDVWGNAVPMGLAEAAARTHAPPLTFDRRGDILKWTDFESASPNYDVTVNGSPVHGRSNDAVMNGNFSYKADLSTSSEQVAIRMYTHDFHAGRLGISTGIATASDYSAFEIELIFYDGSNKYYGAILRDTPNGGVFWRRSDGWVNLHSVDYYMDIHNFSTIKLVVDLATKKYVRALVMGTAFDLSANDLVSSADASTKAHVQGVVKIDSLSFANLQTAYVDNIILTENEPVN